MRRIRCVAIILKNTKVLLMHRIKNQQEYYVFPGGGLEYGETIEQAVLREVKEETSLKIKIEKMLYRHIYDDNTEHFFYLCTYISGQEKLGQGNELQNMKDNKINFYNPVWYQINDIKQLLLYPLEIRDWLVEDIKTNFENTPREVKIKLSEIRRFL